MITENSERLVVIVDWKEGITFQVRIQPGQYASISGRRLTKWEVFQQLRVLLDRGFWSVQAMSPSVGMKPCRTVPGASAHRTW